MRVRRDTDRLFRRRPAPSRLLARAVVVGTRERHIPGVTPRRVAVEVALLALLVSGSWLVPPTVGSPVAHDAMASRRPTDVAETPPAAALPPEALPLPP
ncbi:MAG TPA: hypothetical protein VNA12_08700, partial [Mycobacteriales bacterium]|nr:hypothetical protein [Mycobacteriales bacterium]